MSFHLSYNEANKSPLSEHLADEDVALLIVDDEKDIVQSFPRLFLTNSCACRRIFFVKISNCFN